jgi:hypothetical protein
MPKRSRFSKLLAKSIFVFEAGKLANKFLCLLQEIETNVNKRKQKTASLFEGISKRFISSNFMV